MRRYRPGRWTLGAGLVNGLALLALAACGFPQSWRAVAGEPPASASRLRGGTGFFIDGEGDLVTMRHVIEGCKALSIADARFRAVPARLRAVPSDPGTDLAVLHIDRRTPDFVRFVDIWPGSAQLWELPTEITAFGYPEGGPWLEATAVSLSDLRPARIDEAAQHYFFLSGRILHGNSGSPAFDEHGRVIGVIFAAIADPATLARLHVQAGGFAIPTKTTTSFLTEAHLPWQAAAVNAPALAQAAERRTVARVFCYE